MNFIREKPFYPFVLDHKPGYFLSWFLYRLFKLVRLDENMTGDLKRMHREGTVVYAIKYRGQLDYLLYHYRFRRGRLPYPKISFDMNMSLVLPLSQLMRVIKFHLAYFFKNGSLPSPYKTGFFRDAIRQGTSSLICLVDPKGFEKRFIHAEKDHLHFLIETQKTMERPIYIVPQLILYKKTPEKEHPNLLDIFFGFKDKPGFVRKIGLFFRHHRQAFIDFGRPLDLKAYMESQPESRPAEEITSEIRQLLIESIDGQKRVILGPIMKSRQQVKEKVLGDREITGTIEKMAAGNGKRLKQLRKEAGANFDEIAADYNVAYVQFFFMALTWFWKKIYQGIDANPQELAMVRDWARKGNVIYIPSHKSHIDYLVLNYIFVLNHVHMPRVAAGKNLAFWPMGHIFRKSGAFFIRRTFKGAPLYSQVFERYIKVLLEEGHPLEFFIEGGRSRSGKLILPKTGFLSILLKAKQDGYCKDLVFVPASISYDRILEEKSYLKELGGTEKKRESFKQMIKARRFLKRKYGKIYIRFGEPFSLNQYLDEKEVLEQESLKPLASQLIRSINKTTLVIPLSLTASAILTKHRRGFLLHELTATMEMLLGFLKTYEIPMANTFDQFEKTVEETLALLINRKIVSFLEDVDGAETFYYVDEEKKPELEYYKNSIIHCFIGHAFVAVSLLTGKEEIKTHESILTDYGFLRNLFKNEFIYNVDEEISTEVKKITVYFLEKLFITRANGNGGYTLTRLGFDQLPMWAALAKTFLESYWIAARSFIQQEKSSKKGDILKNMNYMGLRFHKLGLIDHMEAISRLSFKNAIRFINEDILKGGEESEEDTRQARKRLGQLSHRLYELSHYRA
ncbi:MAG: 1-acyl-sn-glycerol-3-phosphate acyltransferase [Desulfobacterales bacterium]|nr:1-acyl-sn-glycerol-3-phosphate acyltransferase [Desulfobacterales bacterium]